MTPPDTFEQKSRAEPALGPVGRGLLAAIACLAAVAILIAAESSAHADAGRTIRLFGSLTAASSTTYVTSDSTTTIFETSGGSWTVPSDWNNGSNVIEAIGGGAGGGSNTGGSAQGRGGGGGGAYAISVNVTLTAGAAVAMAIGASGADATNGGDTYLCNDTANCSSIAGSAVVVGAKGGSSAGYTTTGGLGGSSAASIGDLTYAGGDGGTVDGTWGGGGGGGAGGPYGPGGSGGGATKEAGGGGGGGGGGTDGQSVTSTTGGTGGNNHAGFGGGAANGGTGSNGGGGGGGQDTSGSAGAGGAGRDWNFSHGSGGGGGGGGDNESGNGARGGGNYGAGGGGAAADTNETGAAGAPGIVVISYRPLVLTVTYATTPIRSLRLIGAAPAVNNQLMLVVHRQYVATSSAIANFPVYVDLSTLPPQFWAAESGNNCGDIRVFASDKTTELPREVVTCNTTSDAGELWFKAPSLSSTLDTVFYVSFGSGASDYATSATYGAQNVWTNGYQAVYHFPNGATLSLNDSTSNGNTAANNGATATVGKLDGAAAFNGSSNYIDPPDMLPATAADFTIEAWVRTSSTAKQTVFSNNTSGNGRFDLEPSGDTAGYEQLFLGSGSNLDLRGTTYIADGNWHQVVATRSSSNFTLYADAQFQASGSKAQALNSANQTIGAMPRGSAYMNGTLDQVTISSIARSAGWIQTEYNNQASPETFYTATMEYNPLVKVFAP